MVLSECSVLGVPLAPGLPAVGVDKEQVMLRVFTNVSHQRLGLGDLVIRPPREHLSAKVSIVQAQPAEAVRDAKEAREVKLRHCRARIDSFSVR